MKKSRKKQNNPKIDECIRKGNVERSCYNNHLQDYKLMKRVKIAMDVCWSGRRESVCKKK